MVAALCLATDLGMGYPFEHGLRMTLIGSRLAAGLGVDPATASQAYYACMFSHAGCTTDAHVTAEVFGGSLTENLDPVLFGSARQVFGGLLRTLPDPERATPVRALQTARGIPRLAREQRPHLTASCEVAGMLAEGIGLEPSYAEPLAYLTDRWDGKGPLRRGKGDEIPLAIRILHVAADAALQQQLRGKREAAEIVREHAGRGLDPAIAGFLAEHAGEILGPEDGESAWEECISCEPGPNPMLSGEGLDRALAAMGDFADLISPHFTGHCRGVAELAGAAAERCRLDDAESTALRRAALVHDLGRVGIGARTWEKPGPLNADEWERVRLHPYQTERVLSRSTFLSQLAPTAGAHHERLDGSGYHRGASGPELSLPARLLAAADAYHAMTEPRPHREAMGDDEAADELAREAEAGRLDAEAVTAVLEAAGQPAPELERPAGLTEREVEVLGLLARGLQTKQVGRALGISTKTADRHIQNAYRKTGVSTRAAATLFAMQHGLVTWGELPIAGSPGHT